MEDFIAAIFRSQDAAVAARADLQQQIDAGELDVSSTGVYERNATGEFDSANFPGSAADEALNELDVALPQSNHVLLIQADDRALAGIQAVVSAHDGTMVQRSQGQLQSDAYGRFMDSTGM